LPVVCHSSGGYREYIEHGKNGFLFDGDEEAFQIILRLKQDVALRRAIGSAARRSMEQIFSPGARQTIVAYYLK
jgi:glycosyltransferase involved in cell wall biosynthesis